MALISTEAFNDLKAAFAKWGVAVYDSQKPQLEAKLKNVADSDATRLIGALADDIKLNGLANVMQGATQRAIKGAIPTAVDVINDNIDGGADAIDALLHSWATPS